MMFFESFNERTPCGCGRILIEVLFNFKLPLVIQHHTLGESHRQQRAIQNFFSDSYAVQGSNAFTL